MGHKEALKMTGEIMAATIVHMAKEAKCSVDAVIAAIAQGGAARDRFNSYMDLAEKEVARG